MLNEQDKLEFEKSLELRNLEINNFWKRGWFFGALIIAFFSLYLKVKEKIPSYSIYISLILSIAAVAQAVINRGSKYWQERWEYKVKNRESKLKIDVTKTERYNNMEYDYIHDCIDAKNENIFVKATRYSVSKIAMLVWDSIAIFFILLWLNDIFFIINSIFLKGLNMPVYIKPIAFHLIYIIYFFMFFKKSQMKNPSRKKKTHEENKKCANDYVHDKIEPQSST